MVKTVDSDAEYYHILASSRKVVVQWSAAWCSHCKAIAPKLAEYDDDFADVTFIKVDVDEFPEVSEKAGLRAMPTFHFYLNGLKADELVGADNAKLIRCINRLASEE
ncbi:Cytoplasmic thioredoxin isoenzyme 2 [Podila epicladia]|nr:Cytoplasmic thioredoxin isoenzyme 2 [Podila epicladia]KAG0087526.1 Cytoplasmic thioredoxin isoenzyme 2 [Podila epicladia]